jgi:hypothetical protein
MKKNEKKDFIIAIIIMFSLILILATLTNLYGIDTKLAFFLVVGIGGAYIASVLSKSK